MRIGKLKTIVAAMALSWITLIQWDVQEALSDPGSSKVPTILSSQVVKVVDPFNPDPTERLYGTLDMMDLVETKGEKIVVIAHEIFPPETQGDSGDADLPGFPLTSPDSLYETVNVGLGLGAVSAWNLKTGEFSFIIRPKNTLEQEPYNENRHTSGTDGVRATAWGTALIAEEWTQDPSAKFGTPARGGHILEVDPLNPGALSRVKVMGSFSHEGIAIQIKQGNYVFFQGDENRGDNVGTWSDVPEVPNFACAEGTPKRGGAFYRFIPSMKPTKFGDLQANGGTVAAFDFFTNQWVNVPADVVDANNPDIIRCWADTNLSPVSLWERPEDVEYDANSGNLYFAVTEKSCVVENGTCLVDDVGDTVDENGDPISFDGARLRAGHVIRLNPDTGDWSVFVDADIVNNGISVPIFGSPDNLVLDKEGRVFIAQDGGSPNDSIWLATPDKGGDGVADHFQRFLNMTQANLGTAANGGEPTGFLFIDSKTLLFNWQGGNREDDFGSNPRSRIMMIELGGSSESLAGLGRNTHSN